MTTLSAAQVLEMPEEGMERELIRGSLRERPKFLKDRRHSLCMPRLARFLEQWLDEHEGCCGEFVCGAGFILDPTSGVGIDVAYVAPATPGTSSFFEGPPRLAVEILSPEDEQGWIDEKIELYLESGVAMVWTMNPRFRTVTVYRPGVEPVLFSASQELTAEPVLPGFRVRVSDLFSR